MTRTLLGTLVCVAGLLLPAAAGGVALSEIELHSHLNQPLDARVPLLAASQGELDSLQVTVNNTSQGGAHVSLQPEVVRDPQGPYVRITSRDTVREPVLTLEIQLNWSGGRFTREYSLIIDPQ